MPQIVLDSHIHLWPASAANPQSHSWMQEGEHLTKQYSINDYVAASNSLDPEPRFQVAGFVYVETDRTVGKEKSEDVYKWAAEPLKEIAFLRRIVEGKPRHGEAFSRAQSYLLKGIVAWAPLDRGYDDLLSYLTAAKEVAGAETWSKIKGFRFLLQGIRDEQKFLELVRSSSFVELLQYLGKERFSFDVGVDQRQAGVWQLEYFANVIENVHNGVEAKDKTVFVINHLCKPDMEQAPDTTEKKTMEFERWKTSISRFAKQENVYMKLSGAFSEITDQNPEHPLSVPSILERTKPWLNHVFSEFGPGKIMFGSDWPVCNVRGPGDSKSWRHWINVVEQSMHARGFSNDKMDRVWFGTAMEAYRIASL